jgi:hypothetical protein
MGKRISEARWGVDLTARIARYYATHAERFLEPLQLATPHGDAWVKCHPIGVVVAVEPWNFPYYQLIRVAGPNIAVGNPVLAKHASNVPQAALAFEELIAAAGAPPGVWTNLFASGRNVGSQRAMALRFALKSAPTLLKIAPPDRLVGAFSAHVAWHTRLRVASRRRASPHNRRRQHRLRTRIVDPCSGAPVRPRRRGRRTECGLASLNSDSKAFTYSIVVPLKRLWLCIFLPVGRWARSLGRNRTRIGDVRPRTASSMTASFLPQVG